MPRDDALSEAVKPSVEASHTPLIFIAVCAIRDMADQGLTRGLLYQMEDRVGYTDI
jgi:hypothetical protein